MEQNKFDVIIIGGGIVGSMIARELSRYRLSIAVLEKESDIGMGQSSANSAILHSGHDPFPGTLKARLNKRGNELWKKYSGELGVAVNDTGAMVVAIGAEERPGIKQLYERAVENGIQGVEIWSREAALKREQHLSPECSGALWTPTASVVDAFEGVVATAENAVMNGVRYFLNTSVQELVFRDGSLKSVKTNNGEFHAEWFINSAGVHSDEIMHMAGDRPDFSITPRRGEYLVFDRTRIKLENALFPMPSKKGKGVLVSTTVHGNIIVGPNADIIDEKEDSSVTGSGMEEIFNKSKTLVPSLDRRDVIAVFSGVRAMGNYKPDGKYRDFLIEISGSVRGLVNLGGIESPGYVSAPAIAEEVAALLEDAGLVLTEKTDFNPVRVPRVRFTGLSHAERAALIDKNPAYGRIVCRCEEVTEGEVIDAIHAPIPALTYDAIKRRTWLGTGRCQGGFDYPRLLEILSRETGGEMTDVTKRGPGSSFLVRRTKDSVQEGI